MKPRRRPQARGSLAYFGAAALLAMTAATAQVAGGAPGTTGIDASGNYQSEVQACASGATAEDRETCLKEARNARAEKARGQVATAPGTYQANAEARCDVFTGNEKAECQARVMGGNTSGSVAGGGLLREHTTTVQPPAPASADPAAGTPLPPLPPQRP